MKLKVLDVHSRREPGNPYRMKAERSSILEKEVKETQDNETYMNLTKTEDHVIVPISANRLHNQYLSVPHASMSEYH